MKEGKDSDVNSDENYNATEVVHSLKGLGHGIVSLRANNIGFVINDYESLSKAARHSISEPCPIIGLKGSVTLFLINVA